MDAEDGADPTALQQRSDQPAQPKSAAPSPSTIQKRTGSPFSPATESSALELSRTDTENTPEQPRLESTAQAPPSLKGRRLDFDISSEVSGSEESRDI